MASVFLSAEWIQEVQEAINTSRSYQRHGAGWKYGPIHLVITEDDETVYTVQLDLNEGVCKQITITEGLDESAGILLKADYKVWKDVLEKRLNPAAEIAGRRMHFKGNWLHLLSYQEAARALMEAVASVETQFK